MYTNHVHPILNPLAPTHIFVEVNMVVISETLVNISKDPNIIENVFIGAESSPEEVQIYTNLFKEFRDVFAWSYEEMPGIDPSIIQHEIKTYENAKPVNLNKCVFAVTFGRLLGFIVPSKGIGVDPFKVEAILWLPPPLAKP